MDKELETKTENLHETDLTKKPKSFKLAVGEEEFIRMEEGGKIYVRGELVDDNKMVYEGFLVWLQAAQECTRRQLEELEAK